MMRNKDVELTMGWRDGVLRRGVEEWCVKEGGGGVVIQGEGWKDGVLRRGVEGW